MHIVVTGGTGFVGRALSRSLAAQGHRVTVLSRGGDNTPASPGIEVAQWNPLQTAPALFDGRDAVVNLAGESIAVGRWTEARKQRIMDSRVRPTRALVSALGSLPQDRRPLVLVSASAAGYYGPRGDEDLDEDAPPGNDFLARVCLAWENEARAAEALGVRVVLTRLGMVLGPDGGILSRLVPPFRLGLGGPIGCGIQWLSWVHLDDAVAALLLAVENEAARGPLNVTSPHPVRNREFARILGRVLGRPSLVPLPAALLRLVLGEIADLLLTGQRVLPARLKELSFGHRFPTLPRALADALAKRC